MEATNNVQSLSTAKIYSEFLKPGMEYRGKPFWAWNGKLERDELIRQVHIMKEMGFGGFFMHSRTGLETEYLGEEWFELINACADEAEKLGLEAWLYDEDRWPSGPAGGMVTVEQEYRMKSVKLTIVPAVDFRWNDDILAAFLCKLDGLNFYDCRRVIGDISCNAEGLSVLVFNIVEMSKHSFYNGFTYLDTLSSKATNRFLELTHEKYKERCGNRFGRSIKGIFTDEPHRGTLMDAFGAGNDKDIWRAPWTGSLPDEFIKKHGYDLINKLPELFLKSGGNAVSQVKWHYTGLLVDMFLENFLKPVNEWCSKNDIILTGHVLHEDSLTAQTVMNGSVMRSYEQMEYPGVDVLTEANKNYWVVKQLSSTARQLGKRWLLSELYGCTGWQMNFESHKAVGDWQALFGINIRCHHLSWYTMKGEAKRDFPASILHQSAWWREYKHVEDYFSRIGLLMSQGKPLCEVLVINPVESVWCMIHPGYSYMLEARSAAIAALEEKYRYIFHWLTGYRIDFDYGDEEMMSRLSCICLDEEDKPVLTVGMSSYKVVIVGGMITIRSTTLRILREFQEAGGCVIFAGEPPSYVDALESDDAGRIAAGATLVPFGKPSLLAALETRLCHFVGVEYNGKGGIDEIYCQVRDDGTNKFIFLLNVNREKAYRNVLVTLRFQGFAEEWVCGSGERYAVGSLNQDGVIHIKTDFEAGQEHLYVISPIRNVEAGTKPCLRDKEVMKLQGPYEYELDECNVCVLDMAQYKLGGSEWQEENEILKVDRIIREKLVIAKRGGEMLQPWFAKSGGYLVKEKLFLRFEFHLEHMPEGGLELAMEQPEDFSMFLNGQPVDSSNICGWWVDKCFMKISLPVEVLNFGLNSIGLEIEFNEGVNLEALYLLGKFGVKLDGSRKTLTGLPEKIGGGNLTVQGFPFYSGKFRYKLKIDRKPKKGERIFISFDRMEAACIKILSNDDNGAVIAWRPYEADITDLLADNNEIVCEVALTRRNTFGPLHQVPLYSIAYGPDNFVTEGDQFTPGYMLVPSGLIDEPKIIIRCDTGQELLT